MRFAFAAVRGFLRARLRAREISFAGLAAPIVAIALASGAAAQTDAPPLEVYGALPTMEHVAISPAGDRLAFDTMANGKQIIAVGELSGKVLGLLSTGDQKLRGLAWAGEDNLLITASQTTQARDILGPRQEWYMTEVYNVTDKSEHLLLNNVENAMNVTIGEPSMRTVDGKIYAFVTGYWFGGDTSEGHPALFRTEIGSNSTTLVEGRSTRAQDWLIDEAGQPYAEADYSELTHHWGLKLKQDASWNEVFGVDEAIDTPDLLGLSEDGKSVLLNVFAKDGYALQAISLADGKPVALADTDSHFSATVEDPATHRVIGTEKIDTGVSYDFTAPANRGLWRKVTDAFLGEQVELVSWSDDKSKIIVKVTGTRDGVEYELVDLTTNRAQTLGLPYKIDPDAIAGVQAISYKAADGTAIPAYLTLPRGRPAKNLPLIVLPHGGPFVRDEPGFDWWPQAMASRGYAVLQPQYRGSSGFGWDFLSAGFGEWGKKMQTDLSDGVRALAAQGTIDPKRVCIVGASYGGYAALAGATLDPGVYRCAVSVSGISDLREMLRDDAHQEGRRDSLALRYEDRFLGLTGGDGDDATLDAISPIKHIDKVTIPILLVHGRDDTVVMFHQSDDMADALKKAGKDVTFVTLETEDHWLSRAETRTQMLQAVVGFLEKENPAE